MNALLTAYFGFLTLIRTLVGIVLPIFRNAADFRGWPTWLKLLLQFVVIGGICVGLFFLQRWTGLTNNLYNALPALQPFFLPLLFLLVVAFSWLASGLWSLLRTDNETAEFADIAEAWSDVVTRLSSEGLGIGDAPLFMILGRPAAGLDALFMAAGVQQILTAPHSGDSPLRVYAWDEAIFVTCPGASAWAHFCHLATNPDDDPGTSMGGGEPSQDKTMMPGQVLGGLDPALQSEFQQLLRIQSERGGLEQHDRIRLDELGQMVNAAAFANRAVAARSVRVADEVRVRETRRLRYLCQLIRQDRSPWCPINGILVVIPWASTETDDNIRMGMGILEQELTTASEVFQLRYPTYALVSDLETARGFSEFRREFRPEQLRSRVGQRYPLVPQLEPEEAANHLGNVARWIGLSVLPRWILEFLKLEVTPDIRKTPGVSSEHNRNLYLLQRAVFERGPRLAGLLARGIPKVGGGHDDLATSHMFGGCYYGRHRTRTHGPSVRRRRLPTGH